MGGGTPVGPKAWQEWNVNELTDITNYDEISGFPVYKALLCDVMKVGEGTGKTPRMVNRQLTAGVSDIVVPQIRKGGVERRIYLDNNATTRVADAVREAMVPFLEVLYGNPNSIYGEGREAREAVEEARRRLAKLINARPRRVIL